MPKAVYTVRQAARVLDVSTMKVYRLLKEGGLKSAQLGGQFRVTAASLRKCLRLGPEEEIVVPPEPEQAEAES